ncbi:Protein UmuD [Neochlamydia sp. TUME1]|jgi:DNA polymerase V|uniref:LexA family protein n=1 Tax=unclassified Neochlamydia TaxID=2643326 RepID=UPI000582E233|nr:MULTISPECIES: translesion error-prone DNA polymerase V autoproteolytic subunit [unclassified Neochlamydia]KIC73809.1 Protein UmuD [Neochlamydia sp. TUME1]BBI16327.1 protein umuD [Neochlamydia sp. S13]
MEETKAIQVPASEIQNILKFIQNKFYRIPLYQYRINAGFPSFGEGDIEKRIDLNELLIKEPDVTFLLKVCGDSMINAGIHHNDIIVVDRSIEPSEGKIVIASLNGELTVKRLRRVADRLMLVAENKAYAPIEITEDTELRIWGVAISVIHAL